jgi:hypothetical protein
MHSHTFSPRLTSLLPASDKMENESLQATISWVWNSSSYLPKPSKRIRSAWQWKSLEGKIKEWAWLSLLHRLRRSSSQAFFGRSLVTWTTLLLSFQERQNTEAQPADLKMIDNGFEVLLKSCSRCLGSDFCQMWCVFFCSCSLVVLAFKATMPCLPLVEFWAPCPIVKEAK